jgi:hypothetical protein
MHRQMILLQRDEAIESPDPESFRRHVRDAARSANEFIMTVIMTICRSSAASTSTVARRDRARRLAIQRVADFRGRAWSSGPDETPVIPDEEPPPPVTLDPDPLLETPNTTASRGLRHSDLVTMAEEFVERFPEDQRGGVERNETVAIGLVEDADGL